jgi:hypothetical protein
MLSTTGYNQGVSAAVLHITGQANTQVGATAARASAELQQQPVLQQKARLLRFGDVTCLL